MNIKKIELMDGTSLSLKEDFKSAKFYPPNSAIWVLIELDKHHKNGPDKFLIPIHEIKKMHGDSNNDIQTPHIDHF